LPSPPSLRGPPRDAPFETPIARDFFAGHYAKIAAETFDGGAPTRDEEAAFAIGALTFLGRVSDAEILFDGLRRRGGASDPRTAAASRFFLGLAHARAGDFARARELLVAGVRARLRSPDPWAAAFAFQGLACFRYFTGRYRAAARHALRALRTAHLARFAWVQMIATDLRGHALVQLGQLEAGTALLAQGKAQAERLGLGNNAYAIEVSIVAYRARFKVGAEALSELTALLGRRAHDSYSRRALLTQAAVQYAVRGRGAEAAAVLAEVDREALRMDARRAKVTSLLARLHVTRWARGLTAAAELIDEARALIDSGDVAFRAELLAFELMVGDALGEEVRRERALDGLRALRREADHHAARTALAQAEGERARAFAEDELSALLHAVARRDERALPRLLAAGLLGPVPELVGIAPGRGVVLLPSEGAVLIHDRGDLWLRPGPPRWAPPLLRLLAGSGASKEAIVAGLWGLRRYVPVRHDPLVRTTIHRLRGFLDPRGEWVTVTAQGYGLSVPVHVVGGAEPAELLEAPLPEEEGLAEPPRLAASAPRDTDGHDRRLLDHLARVGEASAPDLARALGVSESTALRAARRLCAAKKITRAGAARATRYHLRG
jgi:hypothetical protein